MAAGVFTKAATTGYAPVCRSYAATTGEEATNVTPRCPKRAVARGRRTTLAATGYGGSKTTPAAFTATSPTAEMGSSYATSPTDEGSTENGMGSATLTLSARDAVPFSYGSTSATRARSSPHAETVRARPTYAFEAPATISEAPTTTDFLAASPEETRVSVTARGSVGSVGLRTGSTVCKRAKEAAKRAASPCAQALT